jgi:hypothetical protein
VLPSLPLQHYSALAPLPLLGHVAKSMDTATMQQRVYAASNLYHLPLRIPYEFTYAVMARRTAIMQADLWELGSINRSMMLGGQCRNGLDWRCHI